MNEKLISIIDFIYWM